MELVQERLVGGVCLKLGEGWDYELDPILLFRAINYLTVPKSFVEAGYAFSCGVILISGLLSIYCMGKLIDMGRETGIYSFQMLGYKAFGSFGFHFI
jgi:amino acid permease